MSKESDPIVRIVKYALLFWSVCIVAGAGMAVGLAHAGMKVQDAFNSGAVIAFLPGIIAGVGAVIFYWFA